MRAFRCGEFCSQFFLRYPIETATAGLGLDQCLGHHLRRVRFTWPAALSEAGRLRLLAAFHVVIHELQRNLSWAGKAIPANLTRAGKDARRKFLKHRLHLHGAILVNPAARCDVNGFAGPEGDFKHVSVAVQPQDAFLR